MSILTGIIQWSNKRKFGLVLLLLTLIVFIYSRYVYGPLTIECDSSRAELAELIMENWANLENDGYQVFESQGERKLFCFYPHADKSESICSVSISMFEDQEIGTPAIQAGYRRKGLALALKGWGRFSDCETFLSMTCPALELQLRITNSEPGDGLLEAELDNMLKLLESSD